MKVEKNKIVEIPWKSREFNSWFYLDNKNLKNIKLLLDTIKVYFVLDDGSIGSSDIPFNLKRNSNGIMITPELPYKKYIVTATRIVRANVVEIKADDYIHKWNTMGGSYGFVFKNDAETEELQFSCTREAK